MKQTPLKRKTPLKAKAPMKPRRSTKRRAAPKEHTSPFGGGPKLKKRTMRKRRPYATTGERLHMGRVCALGCAVDGCTRPANIHHIRTGYGTSQRASHWEVLPLCKYHHQDGPIGEAFHAAPRTWMAKHGTEVALLVQVYKRLEIPFETLLDLRCAPPPWWGSYLDGSALVSPAARIFKQGEPA